VSIRRRSDHVRPTKRVVIDECRRLLAETKPLAELEGRELAFVRALLERHPEARAWAETDADVEKITVARWGGEFHTRCFYVHYTNGKTSDFSYRKCVGVLTTEDVRALCGMIG
jgi:hypothetical protein